MPDISIIISAYNSKEFLRHRIKNILNSKNIDYEVIIIDCDGGKELKLVEHLLDDRFITKTYQNRTTIWKSINDGIQMSSSDYIVMANTDDLVSPEAYSLQHEACKNGADISYFDYYITDGYKETWENATKTFYSKYVTSESGYSPGKGLGPFPMWAKSLHDQVGLFNEELEIFGDSLFWTALADRETAWHKIDDFHGAYAQRNCANLESNLKYAAKDRKLLKNLKTT